MPHALWIALTLALLTFGAAWSPQATAADSAPPPPAAAAEADCPHDCPKCEGDCEACGCETCGAEATCAQDCPKCDGDCAACGCETCGHEGEEPADPK